MTDRERFEEWVMSRAYWVSTIQDDVGYKSPATRVAFDAWQASRKQAFAEAINICEECEDFGSEDLSLSFCLHDLRRLANPEGEQG